MFRYLPLKHKLIDFHTINNIESLLTDGINKMTYPKVDASIINLLKSYVTNNDTYLANYYLLRKYADYSICTIYDDELPSDLANDFGKLKITFDSFCVAKASKYLKMFEATILEFNPLYNVDGTEVKEYVGRYNTNTITGTDTTTYNISNTVKKTGDDKTVYDWTDKHEKAGDIVTADTEERQTENINTGSKLTNHKIDSRGDAYVNGYDVTEFGNGENPTTVTKVNSGNVTVTDTTSDTESKTGNEKIEFNNQIKDDKTGTEALSHNTTNRNDIVGKEILTRQGNIGVTKSTDLLESYVSFASTLVIERLFDEFIKENGVIVDVY